MKITNKKFHKRLLAKGYVFIKTHRPYAYIKASAWLSEYKHPKSKRRVTVTKSSNYWTVKNGKESFGGTIGKFFKTHHKKHKVI